MHYPKYDIQATRGNTRFSFVSTGPKGDIQLFVLFKLIDEVQSIYNLELGPLNSKGEIDDLTVIANGDRNKILATVTACVFLFFKKYSSAIIYFTGSTSARTRLYQRAIHLNISQLQSELIIWGETDNREPELYVPGKNYDGFFVVRKSIFE